MHAFRRSDDTCAAACPGLACRVFRRSMAETALRGSRSQARWRPPPRLASAGLPCVLLCILAAHGAAAAGGPIAIIAATFSPASVDSNKLVDKLMDYALVPYGSGQGNQGMWAAAAPVNYAQARLIEGQRGAAPQGRCMYELSVQRLACAFSLHPMPGPGHMFFMQTFVGAYGVSPRVCMHVSYHTCV